MTTPARSAARERPRPTVSAHDVGLDGLRGARFTLARRMARPRSRISLPGLYNVYNALAAAALACALAVEPPMIAAGLGAAEAVFGRGERVRVGERDLAILLVKNPAGANEVLRTLGARGRRARRARRPQRRDRRRSRRLVDLGCRLRDARAADRRADLLGDARRRVALRLQVRRGRRRSGSRSSRRSRTRSTGRSRAAPPATLYALPTYTAMLALRGCSRSAGRRRARGCARERLDAVVWHDLECGGYEADLAAGRSSPLAATDRCWTSAPGPVASRLRWRAPDTR